MYTPTSKLLEEGTHSLPASTGPHGQSAEWRDPWDGQLPLPISLAPKTFQMWNEQDFTWNFKKWTTKLIFKIFIDLIVTATIGENLFFPLISKHLLVWKDSYKKKKKNDHGITQDQPQDCMVPSVIHPWQWNGWEKGQGTTTSKATKGRSRKELAVSAFPFRMELGHWWQ